MTAVVLGLVTALFFGVASYLGPVLSRTNTPSAVLAVGQAAAVAAAAVLLLAQDAPDPTSRTLVLGLLAGVANGVALTAMFEAARFLPISVMAPIGATGGGVPVVVALALGERPHVLQLVGIPVAMIGVVLVAAGSSGGSLMRNLTAVPSVGLWLAATWAVSYGVFLSLFAEASDGGGQPWALFSSRVSLLATALVLPLARRTSLRLPWRMVPLVALNGLLILAGVATFGWAAAIGPVSVVSVLATLSPVITVAMAVLLLRERLGGRQRIGLAAAIVGVVLLAAG
ncbi:DMT family transporter [Blastococcus sp. CT_GayMR19]|uniref:DMT family transporter n=1 Tax=Blastococcus sp. CT_GayMR19 TaxID=2559608 RepID=UPI0010732FBD|nr:DMT family transporter [Blastococcus sp. CT_GayMR19]TFV71568.1 DMT family transporter [Blastococcus sp. CT_GayMR19]